MPNEIIGIVAKCNVTEKVWEMLLNRFGRANAGVLLHKIVQSNAFNGPEVTKLILQRYGTTEDKEVLALAASNEGNVAAGITRALLEHGRDPNAPTSTGLTPIHDAARNESNSGPEIMKLLLERGGNPNVRSTNDSSMPVHWASANQGEYAVEILKHLLDSGGDYDAVEEHYFKPIHLATMNSSKFAPELLDLLLKNGGIDDIYGKTRRSLVHLATFNDGDYVPAILEKLFENGAKPNDGDIWKQTPLHYLATNSAANQENTIAKILISNGGNPNAVDQWGKTPVHYAAANLKENDHETLNVLLTNEGSVRIKDNNGFTPIHYALLNTGIHGNQIRELVGVSNENINADLDKFGNTLLHHIVLFVCTKTTQTDVHVQLLLDHGGNPNIQNKLGQSPVHLAVINPSSDSTTVLQLFTS
jgi:ankyrin repeat protein